MITRSMSRMRPLYEVNIDFDEASTAWKANKISTGNGCYKYIDNVCGVVMKNGNTCMREKCHFHKKKRTSHKK
jgi:hypothetical protein